MNFIMSILDILFEKEMMVNKKKFIMPCPNCGINDAVDCGFGYKDYWGEFDCHGPEDVDDFCEYCKYAWCDDCKKESEIFSILSIENFII